MNQATCEPDDWFLPLVVDAQERTFGHWEEDPVTTDVLCSCYVLLGFFSQHSTLSVEKLELSNFFHQNSSGLLLERMPSSNQETINCHITKTLLCKEIYSHMFFLNYWLDAC